MLRPTDSRATAPTSAAPTSSGTTSSSNWPGDNDTNPDTARVSINEPWLTGPYHYIRAYTPTRTDEVGTSQRHNGTAGTGYRLAPNENTASSSYVVLGISTDDGYVRIEGIEIDWTNLTGGAIVTGIDFGDNDGVSSTDIRISHNLIHSLTNSAARTGDVSGINNFNSRPSDDTKIFNNFIFDISNNASDTGSDAKGIRLSYKSGTQYVISTRCTTSERSGQVAMPTGSRTTWAGAGAAPLTPSTTT